MKKYTSQATKWLMIVSLICGVVLLTGIIFAFAGIGNIGVLIGLILMGGLLGIILFSCFIAEKSRALIINADQITFPRGVEINGKTVFQKTTIQTTQIKSILIGKYFYNVAKKRIIHIFWVCNCESNTNFNACRFVIYTSNTDNFICRWIPCPINRIFELITVMRSCICMVNISISIVIFNWSSRSSQC